MRFTIRDLLWLMVVVGLAGAWWFDRSQLAATARRMAVSESIWSQVIRESVGNEELALIMEKYQDRWRPYINKELGHDSPAR